MTTSTQRRLRLALIDFVISALAFLGLLGVARMLSPIGDPWAATWAVGSLGASMTLILACPDSPLAKPYPALVGNTVSAVIGVGLYQLIGEQEPELAALLAVSVSLAVMRMLGALHPPGGASAILAVVGGATVHELGWFYPLYPIALGTCWLLALARARKSWVATWERRAT
ncbi:HPP family protein [Enhygromyxa salina]|uniref:HPP family protein n=1 Tax=Enhygromyxa salina TaxID=215803 RepID=A0A2S9YB22_9BACT|nr:HPP family protein [Enhygromyxa salina]PRQ02317.1 HPP family protein [Enhygromyxa salina]